MKPEEKDPDIELRSDDFQEVLGSVPPWILRWGITTVALVVGLLLAGSAVFKYPDTITATIKLTSTHPAAAIVAKSSGKIQRVYVKDNQPVSQDTYLALIENPARPEDVAYVRRFLKQQVPWETERPVLPLKGLTLGSFQSLYSSYYTTLAEYIQFKQLDYYREKVLMTRRRLEQNETYYRNVSRQKSLIGKQLRIGQRQYARDSLLHAQGLLSDQELENSYNQYLQSLLSYENICTSLESQQIQLAQLHESLYDTEYQYTDKKSQLELQLQSLTMQLQTEIQNWEMTYVLKAPVAGKVTFTNYWTENQNITSGEKAFNVVPAETGTLLGKALLPVTRSGKVKVGQKVNIRFSNYPDTEFGTVKGVVRNISLVSVEVDNQSNYMVEIALPQGLSTTYGKTLPFVPEMEGQADIITDDLSVLERFLLPVKKILNENL